MSQIYLFRHGQAGLRDSYDTLSDLGRRQARLLGEWLASQQIHFRAFYTGGLSRQRQTALEIAAAYRDAGLFLPEPAVDPCWSEFDLSAVYEGIAPQMARDDPAFRVEYRNLLEGARDATSPIHRRWTPSDIAVVRAWVEGRYQYEGESWKDFQIRVCRALESMNGHGPGECVAVSTSATPIGVWMGMALNLDARNILRAAGSLYNASITSFRLANGEVSLFSYNNVPHLAAPELKTFR